MPVVLRHWALEKIEGLTSEAEQARDRIITQIDRIGRLAGRLAERARVAAEKAAACGQPVPLTV